MGKVTKSTGLVANQGISFIGLGKSFQNVNASPEVSLEAHSWQNTSKENSLERTLSWNLEFTSPGSSYPLSSFPIIHSFYILIFGKMNNGTKAWILKILFTSGCSNTYFPLPLVLLFILPKPIIYLFICSILPFDAFIWQHMFQTEVSNALFTGRPLPWQTSP